MNSATSTDGTPRQGGFQARHLYLLLAMAAATWAVVEARDTQPAALLLLSAAVIASGLVAIAVHQAVQGFMTGDDDGGQPMTGRVRDALLREKALVMRSIKELEFDRAMGKVSAADFADIDARLRGRAVALMEQLEVPEPVVPPPPPAPASVPDSARCVSCGAINDLDARFCKACGQRLDTDE